MPCPNVQRVICRKFTKVDIFCYLLINLAATNITEQLYAYKQLYVYMQCLSVKKMAPSEVKSWPKIVVEDRLRKKSI